MTDLPYPATPRYSMTAPGDLIESTQGVNLGLLTGLGHGADPDTFPGVVRLETGRKVDSDPSSELLGGMGAHSSVFLPGSTAWSNMLRVLQGGQNVAEYTEPSRIRTPQGLVVETVYPMEDPGFVPPVRWVE